ncbi:hypothetical protein J3492_00355 [Psychrobacter sp. F1192]|uniref:Uncharacterized protein n=1 Tax=Psychrobacter coccoides TaxID=2818440 RepID=A0ABS3NKN9_9GAMM|nr:hypothetical protein [Psychrobacter coccoides]MBO1529665.1 hypothetical protein [Psychrobacter coccoides]
MLTWSLIKVYWRPIAVLLFTVLTIALIYWYGASQYNKGYKIAAIEEQAKLDVLIVKHAKQAAEASGKYQALKSAREKERGVKYVEVEKIIERPVYLNECIDDDGLSQINSAIASK